MIYLSLYYKKKKLFRINEISKAIDSPEQSNGKRLHQQVKVRLLNSIKRKNSPKNPCPLHHKFYRIKNLIKNDLMNSNLEELKTYLNYSNYIF